MAEKHVIELPSPPANKAPPRALDAANAYAMPFSGFETNPRLAHIATQMPDYLATAELRTCVLKKPPFVRSITCWYTLMGGWFMMTVPAL